MTPRADVIAASVVPSPDRSFDPSRCAAGYQQALGAAGGHPVRQLQRTTGAPICVALYESRPYDLHVPGLLASRMAVTLTPAPVSGGLRDERPQTYDTDRFAAFLTPAGAEAHWHKPIPSRHLGLYFDPAEVFVEDGDGDDGAGAAGPWLRAPIHNARVPGLPALARELEAELQRADAFVDEAVDSLARLMLVRLVRLRQQDASQARSMDPQRMARLRDYVIAHLDARLLVADLAQIVGISPNRFTRDLREYCGLTPHQFVLQCRLERAMQQLRTSALGLADIAAGCGFSSQQHLTHAMKRHHGVTPGQCRAGGQLIDKRLF